MSIFKLNLPPSLLAVAPKHFTTTSRSGTQKNEIGIHGP